MIYDHIVFPGAIDEIIESYKLSQLRDMPQWHTVKWMSEKKIK